MPLFGVGKLIKYHKGYEPRYHKDPIVLYLVLSLDYGGGWAVSPYFTVYKGMNLGTMETQSCYTYIGHV